MTVSIDKIIEASPAEWDEIWRECDYATYFHSREWAEIWQAYTNGKIQPAASMIYFSDGKKALLPLSCQKLGRWVSRKRRYLSSPAGTFGGWLSLDDIEPPHARLLGSYLTEEYRNIIWRFNPYDKLAFASEVTPSKKDTTQAICLDQGFSEIERIWTKGKSGIGRKIRKAKKEGVQIEEASSRQDWKNYYKIYEDSIKRWGDKTTSRYDRKLFEEIFSRKGPKIKLWLARVDGTLIAGDLCFYSKRHVVYWHGAALKDFFSYRPANLIIYEIIRHACNNNYSWFDFNPSGEHEGVRDFKKSFGSEFLPAPVVNTSLT